MQITQPMGPSTPLSRTRVTRCLIGKPGITYKYLGLRMFAHPWRGQRAQGPCKQMRKLSRKLERRAVACADGDLPGPSAFNLVLLNRMEPEALARAKQEKSYGMGAVSVSWHADSSLQDFSTISVYVAHHAADVANFATPPPPPAPPEAQPWRVALRAVRDVEGPTMRAATRQETRRDDTSVPAVLLPLHDGDVYHMLGDFNHHHQHAVIQPDGAGAGSVRYSSTHRVALEEGHTYQSIRRRCRAALAASASAQEEATTAAAPEGGGGGGGGGGGEGCAARWQEEQACLSELEFEWLRQYYIQGSGHADSLAYFWRRKIGKLEALWHELEQLTARRLELLREAAAGGGAEARRGSTAALVDAHHRRLGFLIEASVVLRGALVRRQRLRASWGERERDAIFGELPPSYAPTPCLHRGASPPAEGASLPHELSASIKEVEALQVALGRQKKAATPCYQLRKFGECRNPGCPFGHAAVEDAAMAPPKVTAPPPAAPAVAAAALAAAAPLVTDDAAAAREWPFADTDYGDHYETPQAAYADVAPLLQACAEAAGASAQTVRLCTYAAAGLNPARAPHLLCLRAIMASCPAPRQGMPSPRAR